MNVSVTARHCDVSDGLRRRIDRRAERLLRYNERIRDVEVVFDGEGGQHAVEVQVKEDGGPRLVAQAAGQSFRVALERAMDKVARQARKTRERRVEHQAAKVSPI